MVIVNAKLTDPEIVELDPEWLVDSHDHNYTGYLDHGGSLVVCSDLMENNINCDE